MTEKNKTCKVELYEGPKCGRQVYDDKGMCICHSEREDKDVSLFQKEIDKIFENDQSQRFDFSRFIFPERGSTFGEKHFEKSVIFDNSKFLGEAHFIMARFSDEARFVRSHFSKLADFINTQFSGNANFLGAQFLGNSVFHETQFLGKAEFTRALFSGIAHFYGARFSENAHFKKAQFLGDSTFLETQFPCNTDFTEARFSSSAHFTSTNFDNITTFRKSFAKSGAIVSFDGEHNNENEMWGSGADFTGFNIEKDAVVTFRKVSMQGVRLLESNISRMEFIDVKWPRTSRWHKRRTVADEMVEGVKDYSLIAQVYQGLQENYANWYRYLEAGDFFVGEQEMRRKGKGKWGQYFSLNNAYRTLSYYGQSMLLPLFWLLGVISIVPGLLMYGGVGINLQDKSDIVNYQWSFNISDFLLLKADYWQTFLFNFSFMAFSRSKMHDALTEPWQIALVNFEALVVIGLVAMSLLAVRRRFKRKNF